MRSNKVAAALLLCGLALAACNRHPDANSPQVRGVGYVRLDEVVKKHPLYGELSRIDSNIDALTLQSLGPAVPRSGADVARETQALNRELDAARAKANKVIAQKQADYAAREQAAIRAAIAASGENPGESASQSIANQAAQQAAAVSAQANADFNAYQQSVIAQDRQAAQTVTTQLEERANRQYRQKADQLSAKESQASLEMASRDAPQRLALRTKLNNLALDDAARAQTKAQLAALDKKEADAVAAMRAQDAATLAAYQRQLRAQTGAQVTQQVGQIHAQTSAKLNARRQSVGAQANAQIGNLPSGGRGLSPATQAKIAEIDRQYKAQFRADVNKTISDFNRTKTDLDLRFNELHGVDVGATGSVAKQLDALHKQRDQLYGQIVSQVQRETQRIAAQRGLRVAFINVVAPAGGYDLTDEVSKDVESLHE